MHGSESAAIRAPCRLSTLLEAGGSASCAAVGGGGSRRRRARTAGRARKESRTMLCCFQESQPPSVYAPVTYGWNRLPKARLIPNLESPRPNWAAFRWQVLFSGENPWVAWSASISRQGLGSRPTRWILSRHRIPAFRSGSRSAHTVVVLGTC